MMKIKRLDGLWLVLFTVTFAACQRAPAPDQVTIQTDGRPVARFDESRFFRAHDQFLPNDYPRHVAAEEASFLTDSDEVLGFVIDGKACAYGVSALCYHHVVNDRIGDQPIAVTY